MQGDKFEQDQSDLKKESNSVKPMSPGLRVVVSILMLLASIYLALYIVNVYFYEIAININKSETQAIINKKEIEKGKWGETFYVSYSFNVKDKKHERTFMFGLMPKSSKVDKTTYDSLSEGSTIPVIYSNKSPIFNRPVNDPSRYDKIFICLLGTIVFGFVSLHEIKSMRKKT